MGNSLDVVPVNRDTATLKDAVAYAIKLAGELPKDKIIIVNLSGRGDKDVHQVKEMASK